MRKNTSKQQSHPLGALEALALSFFLVMTVWFIVS